MCTAISYKSVDHYFGRNLDMEYSYDERVTITPRNYQFNFRYAEGPENQHAMIGMAYIQEDYPLYYEAANERGLSMAGLNFPGYADYKPYAEGFDNVAPFELIPWVLSQCSSIDDAKSLLSRTNLIYQDFSANLPATPLHWMISDRHSSIVVEPLRFGLKIYDNPANVLTNSPSFDIHMWHLNNYMSLSPYDPMQNVASKLNLNCYSHGMGALGLPGDLSSSSRFIRAVYTLTNSVSSAHEEENVIEFFHILGSVAMSKGSVYYNGKPEYTLYSSCCNASRGIYYYKTYGNSQITSIHMHKEALDSSKLISYELTSGPQILTGN